MLLKSILSLRDPADRPGHPRFARHPNEAPVTWMVRIVWRGHFDDRASERYPIRGGDEFPSIIAAPVIGRVNHHSQIVAGPGHTGRHDHTTNHRLHPAFRFPKTPGTYKLCLCWWQSPENVAEMILSNDPALLFWTPFHRTTVTIAEPQSSSENDSDS